MGGVDQDAVERPGLAQRDDDPVKTRLSAAAGLPAIAHVQTLVGVKDHFGVAVVAVVVAQNAPTPEDRGQFRARRPAGCACSRNRNAVYPQAGDSAVGVHIQPQMGYRLVARDLEPVRCVRPQSAHADQRTVVTVCRKAIAGVKRALQARGVRKVTGKEGRVDINGANDGGTAQTNDGVIVAAIPAAAALPPIHVLAMIVVEVGVKARLFGADQAITGAEKLVGHRHHGRAQPGIGEVGVACCEVWHFPDGLHDRGALAHPPFPLCSVVSSTRSSSRNVIIRQTCRIASLNSALRSRGKRLRKLSRI